METYRTVFDLTGNPAGIQPDYMAFGMTIGAGLLMLIAAFVLSDARLRTRTFLLIASIAWLGTWVFVAVINTRDVAALREKVTAKDYRTVEGCVSGFGHRGGGRAGGVTEFWTAGGLKFSYIVGQLHPTYHRMDWEGGFVHADSKVRVTYVTVGMSNNREIVRLEVIDHGCSAKGKWLEGQ